MNCSYTETRIDDLLNSVLDEIKPLSIVAIVAHVRKKYKVTLTHERVKEFLHAKAANNEVCSMSLAGFTIPAHRLLTERYWKTRQRVSDKIA